MPVLAVCGCAVCPNDAVPEVKAICDWVSDFPGGKGCVRTTVETIMKARGDWQFDVTEYKRRF